MSGYEYIGKKYKYNYVIIHSLMFKMEMNYLSDYCNRINKIIWKIEKINKTINKNI